MKYSPNYQLHEIAGNSFLVELNSILDLDHVMVLNGIGLDIYKLIEFCPTEAEIVDRICEEYDAPKDIIEKDIHRFLNTLEASGIIIK